MTVKYIECKWRQIKKSVMKLKDEISVRVYDDGMVTTKEGIPFAQVKGWHEANEELLEKLSKATKTKIEESDDIEFEDEPDFEDVLEDGKDEVDSLPTFEPEKKSKKKKKTDGDSWTLNEDGNWTQD